MICYRMPAQLKHHNIMKLSLFNTLTRKREEFKPLDANLVKMYVCGPTVYDHPHIGNARSAVVFDILYRILLQVFGKSHVMYVRNITDIDDKIIERAVLKSITISELTVKTTQDYRNALSYLGCLPPTKEPKATEHLEDMHKLIQLLLEANIAYIVGGNVYFDVAKAKNYTELSGRNLNELYENVRTESDADKRNTADFILWKAAKETDDESAKFTSPFGVGRPGWHIECSAMSTRFLGKNFDIHGGGIDLIFPHHSNEIAQSCSAFPGSSYAKYWVHNGFLTVNQEKMSKSLGNFITVKDLMDSGIKGELIRLLLISTHYRKPLDYNQKAVQDAGKTLNYWYRTAKNINLGADQSPDNLTQEFIAALMDDLNTSKAIKLINSYAKLANSTNDETVKLASVKKMLACARFLGLMKVSSDEWFKTENNDEGEEITKLINQRIAAKKEKNWQQADELRNKLKLLGVVVEDKPDGTSGWRKIDNSDTHLQ